MKRVFTLLIIFATFSCSTSNYTISSYTPKEKADFSKYKTFGYMELSKGTEITPRMLSAALMAQSAISHEMQLRGFAPVTSGKNPDLLINLGTFTDTKHELITSTVAYYPDMYPLYWGPMDYEWGWDGVAYSTVVGVHTYKEGVLLVDVVDAQSKILVWHGSVSQILSDDNDTGNEKNISAAIYKLFQKFPVQATSQSK